MSLNHLETGSEFPPLKENTLRLYSQVFCPWAQRSRLVLAAKNIPFETVNINLKHKPDWFVSLNPSGKVPFLQHGLGDERTLSESLIVSEYLDNLYTENRLQSTDPYTNAYHKLFFEKHFSKLNTCFGKLLTDKDELASSNFKAALEPFEAELKDSDFFGGKKPGMVDYMLWPWFDRLGFVKLRTNFELEADIFPKLILYIERMRQQPAVKKVGIKTEIYEKFFNKQSEDIYDYDIGLQ